jgi:undecaprenyl-diphosphatase
MRRGNLIPEIWFSRWNYSILRTLFHLIPHQRTTDITSAFLVHYPFVCTWIFAVGFYLAWVRSDDKKMVRRVWLMKTVLGFAIAVLITLMIRPLVSWPAPALNPAFIDLFPTYLWGQGARNCFPSHSTLAYFMVSLGFWPIVRKLAAGLVLWTFIFVSLPRVYLGGHYPIDIFASITLGGLVFAVIWQWSVPSAIRDWLVDGGAPRKIRNLLLLVWVIELGEGFRVTESLVSMAGRLASRV